MSTDNLSQHHESGDEPFRCWAILELMGHRRLGGYVQEAQLAGESFLRIDVYDTAEAVGEREGYVTQFYRPAAVYCITPTTEWIARKVAKESTYAPVRPWELRSTTNALRSGGDDDDDRPW